MPDEPPQKQHTRLQDQMEGITAPPASPVEPTPSKTIKSSDVDTVDKRHNPPRKQHPEASSPTIAQPSKPTTMDEQDHKGEQAQSNQSEAKYEGDEVKNTEPKERSEQPTKPSEELQTPAIPQHNSSLESAEKQNIANRKIEHDPNAHENVSNGSKETPSSEAKHVGKTEPLEQPRLNVPQTSAIQPESNETDKKAPIQASSLATPPKTEDLKDVGTTRAKSGRPETAKEAEDTHLPSTDQPLSEKEQPSDQNKQGADAQGPRVSTTTAVDPMEVDTQSKVKENFSDPDEITKPDADNGPEQEESRPNPSESASLQEIKNIESPSKTKGRMGQNPNGVSAAEKEPEGKNDPTGPEPKITRAGVVDPTPSILKSGDANMEAMDRIEYDKKPDSEINLQMETSNASADKTDSRKGVQNVPPKPDSGTDAKHAGLKSKEEAVLTEQNVSVMDIDTSVPGTRGAKTPITSPNKPGDADMQNANEKTAPNTKPSETASVSREDVVMTETSPVKPDTGKNTKPSVLEENSVTGNKSRKTTRKGSQSRLSRARSSSRGGAADSSFDSGGKQDSAAQSSSHLHSQRSKEASPAIPNKTEEMEDDGGPRPVMEAKGLVMRVGNAVFVTENQLDDLKTARLKDKKVLPFEKLSFKELRTYNRDQLRAYCFAYGMERRKKTEMEADMARYLSYWNRGKPGFAIHEYIPTSGRVFDSEFLMSRGSHANQSSASLGGSAYGGVDSSRRLGSRPQSASGLLQDKQNGSGALGLGNSQTSPSTPSAGNANRNLRAGGTPTSLSRGFGTSFKQRVHARQASAKFKAAYNGAGDTIVNVVENAAAYFEGKDSAEVIADQTKSFERYQLNVDLLTEIFDGPIQGDVELPKGHLTHPNGNMEGTVGHTGRGSSTAKPGTSGKSDVMYDIAKRLLSNKRDAHKAELDSFESNLKRVEEEAKHTERRNMKLFQKLERAETQEQVEAIKKEFEKEFDTSMDCTSRPVVRRRIDKTLPPLVIPDEQSRILRFTFL